MRVRKESGLPWIGSIPCDWDVVKFKHIFAPRNDRNPGDAIVLSLYREYGIVPKDSRDDNHNVTSLDTSKYRFVRVGDFVVNKMKAWQGSTAVSDYEGIVSPAYYVYEFRDEKTCRKYFHYLLRSRGYAQQFALLSGGIREGQWDLPADALYNIGIPVPSHAEQSRIVAFLDERCAKIDEAIAKHKALIEKLDEYRKAVITKAVTKGVRGEREMINSNIPWLGSFPSDWEIVKNKDVFSCKKIIVGEKESTTQLLSLTTKGVKTKSKDVVEGKVPQAYDGYQLVNPEQIVMCLFDLDCSAVFAGKSNHVGMVSPAYRVLSCKAGFLPDFADYWFSFVFDKRKYLFYARNLRFTLNYDEFATIPIPCPSPDEQSEIVDFLDKKCAAIDAAKERHQQLIIKLEEYKKSLIYNAVTGKIEC